MGLFGGFGLYLCFIYKVSDWDKNLTNHSVRDFWNLASLCNYNFLVPQVDVLIIFQNIGFTIFHLTVNYCGLVEVLGMTIICVPEISGIWGLFPEMSGVWEIDEP